MIVRDALAAAAGTLSPTSATPRLDAELLMAEALGLDRDAMLLSALDGAAPVAFDTLLDRRASGEPVAYILGRRAFWTIELEVAPGVLIPRPETETLLEAAVDRFGTTGPESILDLGTGSGALLLAALAEWPRAQGLGVDRSAAALDIARRNADRLGLAARCRWWEGDWATGIADRFDLILCNPPYVEADASLPRDVSEWEPHSALFAGADGLDAVRRLAPMMPGLIADGGLACVEIGAGQQPAASALFAAVGLEVACRRDLAGHPRCLVLHG